MKAFCKADICAMILALLSWASRAFLAFSSSCEMLLSKGIRCTVPLPWGFCSRASSSSWKVYERKIDLCQEQVAITDTNLANLTKMYRAIVVSRIINSHFLHKQRHVHFDRCHHNIINVIIVIITVTSSSRLTIINLHLHEFKQNVLITLS